MSATPSAQPAPVAAAPASTPTWPSFTPAPIAAQIAVSAPIAPCRGAPLERTATYLDLRVWPGYAAAAGLEPHELPPTPKDKTMYWTVHYTKTKWGSKDPVKLSEKHAIEKKVKIVEKAPPSNREKKMAARFTNKYDLRCVMRRVRNVRGRKSAGKAVVVHPGPAIMAPVVRAPAATEAGVVARTPARAIVDVAIPGAFPDDAASEAQTEASASDAEPSLPANLMTLPVEVFTALAKRRHVNADEAEPRNAKRRWVDTNAPSPSRAEESPTADRPARNDSTGATDATAAPSAARNAPKLKATLSKCPPPTRTAPVSSNPVLKADIMNTPDFGLPPPPVVEPPTPPKRRAIPFAPRVAKQTPSANTNKEGAQLGGTAPARQSAVVNSGNGTPPAASAASTPASAPSRATSLSRQSSFVIDSASSSSALAPAQPRANALSRQSSFVIDSGAKLAASSASSSAASAPAKPGKMVLLREAPTVIDFGTTTAPSSSSSAAKGLSRQPAKIFHFGASVSQTAASSSSSTAPLVFSHGFMPPAWASKPDPGGKTSRGQRAHKFEEHKEAKGGKKDIDDGAASA